MVVRRGGRQHEAAGQKDRAHGEVGGPAVPSARVPRAPDPHGGRVKHGSQLGKKKEEEEDSVRLLFFFFFFF